MKAAVRNRKTIALSLLALGVGLQGTSALADGEATVHSLALEADAWISQNPPHRNHGGEPVLVVGSPNRSRALVRASTNALRSAVGTSRLVSARLELTIDAVDARWGRAREVSATVDLHAVTVGWTEAGATWLSPTDPGPRPATTWAMEPQHGQHGHGWGRDGARDTPPFASQPSASLELARGQTGDVGFDVTRDVLAFLAGTAENQGWLLKRRDEEGGGQVRFASREGSAPGRLVLTLEPASTGPVTLVSISGDGRAGRPGSVLAAPLVVEARGAAGPVSGLPVTFEVTAGDAELFEQQPTRTDASGRASARLRLGQTTGAVTVSASTPGAAPVVFRMVSLPAASLAPVADTYVSKIGPNRAHGAEPVLRVSPIGRKRTLVRFDPDALRALIRQEEVESAQLELTIAGVAWLPPGRDSFELGAHRLTQAWTEQGATWSSPDDRAPRNWRRDGPRWSMGRPPLPYAVTPSSTATLTRGQAGVVTFDVTEDVRAFAAGQPVEHGWLVKSLREHGPGSVAFGSRESATPPRLLVVMRTGTLTGYVARLSEDGDAAESLANVRVRALTPEAPEATTDDEGQFVLTRVRLGFPVVVEADGYSVGHGRTALVTSLSTVSAVTSEASDRAWFLPPVEGRGAGYQLDAEERLAAPVSLTVPEAPGVEVTIPAGARVELPPGFEFPPEQGERLVLARVRAAALANPLPSRDGGPDACWYAPFFYGLQPEGARVEGPVSIRLPNDGAAEPGTPVPFLQFDPRAQGYVESGSLQATADGAWLEGQIDGLSGPGAPVWPGRLVDVTGEVETGDMPVSGAVFQAGGRPLPATIGPGLVRFQGRVPVPDRTSPGFDLEVASLVDDDVVVYFVGKTYNAPIQLPAGVVQLGPVAFPAGILPPIVGNHPGVQITVPVTGAGTNVQAAEVTGGGATVTLFSLGGSQWTGYVPGYVLFHSPGGMLPDGEYTISKLIMKSTSTYVLGGEGAKGLVDKTAPRAGLTLAPGQSPFTSSQAGATLRVDASDRPLNTTHKVAGVYQLFVQRRRVGASAWESPYQPATAPTTVLWFGLMGYNYLVGPYLGPVEIELDPFIPRQLAAESPLLGAYEFRVAVTDTIGNQGVSAPVQIVFDDQTPVVDSFTGPAQIFHKAPLVFSYATHDRVDQVALVTIEEERGGQWTSLASSPLASGTFAVPVPFTSTPSARYRIAVRDRAGNTTTSSAAGPYVLDNRPATCFLDPLAPISTPLNAPSVTVQVTGSVTEDGPAGLERWILLRALQGTTSFVEIARQDGLGGAASASVSATDQVPDGRYVYRLEGYDRSTNLGVVLSNVLVVDTQPPTLTSFTPADGAVFGPGQIVISATLEENRGLDLSLLSLTCDGAELPVAVSQARNPAGFEETVVTATITRLVHGTHVIRLSASDGAQAVTHTIQLTQDHRPPVFGSLAPDVAAITTSGVNTFRATFHDDTTAVISTRVVVSLESNGGTPQDVTSSATVMPTEATFVQPLADGTHVVTFKIVDAGGSVATASTQELTIDTQPPVLTLTRAPPSLPSFTTAPEPIEATYSDTGTGVVAVRVLFDGADVTSSASVGAGKVSYRVPAAALDGAHTVRIEVTDRAGLVTSINTSFQLDRTGPSTPGVPVAGARPFEPTTTLRWAPSADAGVGSVEYVVLRAEDGRTFVQVANTTATELTVPFPTGERTAFRVVARDALGNQSAPADAKGCEVAGLADLNAQVTTSFAVEVTYASGAPVTSATISERATGAALAHVGGGRYESGSVSVRASELLSLDVVVDGAAFVSGPLLPLLPSPTTTDFGQLVAAKHRLAQQVFPVTGATAASIDSFTSLGFTLGEPTAHGPPAASSSRHALLSGFWHTVDDTTDPLVTVLQLPPVLCARYVPIYFEVLADAPADVTAELSSDGGATWRPVTVAAGSLVAVPAAPAGRRHAIVWDVGQDMADASLADVQVRLFPAGQPERGDSVEATLVRAFSVTSVSPASGTLDLDPTGPIRITFDHDVTSSVANLDSSIVLTDPQGTAYPLTFSVSGAVVTATPTAALPSQAELQLRVFPGLLPGTGPLVFDQHPLVPGLQPFEASYRSGGEDVRPPALASSSPADGASGVPPGSPIVLVFDEALDPASVGTNTFALTSSADGVVPVSVLLLADQRSVLVQPATALQSDRCYTLTVGPDLRDAAGVALGRALHVTFATLATSPATPPAPTITQPPDGSTIVSASTAPVTTLVAGSSAPNMTVQLFVNGYPTGVFAGADENGDWATPSCNLPEGDVTLAAVAMYPGGFPASGLSASVALVVSSNRLGGSTPAPSGSPRRTEVVAGTGAEPYFRRELTFTGPPGQPFDLKLASLRPSAGPLAAGTATVDPANGGGSFLLDPGTERLSAGLFFDGSGQARVSVGDVQVPGDGWAVSLVDPLTGTETEAQEVSAQGAVGFMSFVTEPTTTQLESLSCSMAVRARLLAPGDVHEVLTCGGYTARVQVIDIFGNPTDAVTVNGQPGSTGAVVAMDASGAAEVEVEILDPEVDFLLVARSTTAFEDSYDLEELFLCESEVVGPGLHSQTRELTTSLQIDSNYNSSGGSHTRCRKKDCPENKDRPESSDSTKDVKSEPVLLHNLGETYSVTDLVIDSPSGPSFTWTRTYKSYVLFSGVHGARWNAGYEQRVIRRANGDVAWLPGTARQETFVLLPDGTYRSPEGVHETLTIQGDVATIGLDGARYVFRSLSAVTAPGELERIVDRNGQYLRFEYGVTGAGRGHITGVFDVTEREVATLSYDGLGRVSQIEDLLGRVLRYEYSTQGDLVRVTYPASLTTTEGEPLPPAQQFPTGRQVVYGYTGGYADERLNHLLQFVVAPEQAQALAGVPASALNDPTRLGPLARVETTYETRPDTVMFSRVTKQRIGGSSLLPAWTGQTTPQEAGGTMSFHLELLPVPAGASLNHPVSRTTFVDRMGNLSEYFHNRAGQVVRLREYANRNLRPRGTAPGHDPEFFERTWIYDKDGLCLAVTNPSGSVWRWIFGNEDLNGDGVLTPGEDKNGDGDFDDPEDVQPEDDPRYAFKPGNGRLDRTLRNGQRKPLFMVKEPDARGDTRGGRQPRIWAYTFEPVYNQLRTVTEPCGNDPTYTPQNGGVATRARYTTTFFHDYEQGPPAIVRPQLAQRLGVTEAELDALLTEAGVVLGRGDLNESVADDLRIAGNVVRVEAPSVTLTPEQTLLRGVHGATLPVVSLAEFNAFGQLVRTVDPERNVHRVEYHPRGDPNGDGIPDSPLTDPTGGYLKATITDDSPADPLRNTGSQAPAVRVVTRYFQDRLGNVVRVIDPRGVEHRVSLNAYEEVVRTRAATATPGPLTEPALVAFDYETLFFHNHNGVVVEVRHENAGERDGTGATVATNPYWTRKIATDLLDQPILTLAEVDPLQDDDAITVRSPGVIVSRAAWDRNQDLQLAVKPEGNSTAFVYDERRLPFQVIDGFGTADQGTYTFHYTVNGGIQYAVDAFKDDPTKWPELPGGDVTRTKYDGFDEVLCTTDAELNCGDTVYDPCGRRVRFVRFGPPEEGRPRLLEAEYLYDELDRVFRTDARVFEDGGPFVSASWDRSIPTISTPAPVGELEATRYLEHDALGRRVREVDPKGDENLAAWDGAGRLVSAIGPEFANLTGGNAVRNLVQFSYNLAGQPVAVTSIDRSPVASQESFTSTAAYDALGRLFQATDPAGQTGRLLHDSRSNVIAASDAKSSVMVPNLPGLAPLIVNGHGNVARTFYDGLSRPIRSEVLLKRNGVGDGSLDDTNLDTSSPANPDGKITIQQRFDRNSRLVARSDDNGNTTAYAYDARDRLVYTVGADLSVQRTIYDADSMVRQTVDRNGTVIDRTYDAIGRLLKVQASLRATNLEGTGQAVEGTTVQAFEYDGLSRLRLAVDQNDPLDASDDVVTSFTYDSLSRQLTERHRFRAQTSLVNTFTTNGRITVGAAQIDRTIAREFDLDSNRKATTYSSGRRLDYQIDGADRLQAITDSLGTITATEFLGSRPIASTTGRGTVSTAYSYDQKRRLTGLDHLGPGGQRVAGFSYVWDRADRRSSETHLAAPGVQARTETYTYDSAYRITQVAFGDARPSTSWVIDGVGNWVSRTEGGQTQTQNQRQNGKYAPDLMNEVQRLATFDALGSLVKDEQQTQDPNGNRIRSGEFRLSFDVFDRLVRVERTSDGQTVGRYRYDALGRRVDRWFVARGEAVGQQVFHVSDGAQEVEEVDAAGNVVADYVWGGLYLDQVVQVRRGGQEYFAHTNSMFSVAAVTDASGAVVERYEYSSIYGVCEVRDAAGAPKAAGAEFGNPWRFQGRRYDPETGFYYFRLRFLDPAQGRFVNRDPLGIWGDPSQFGNAYSFAGNDPVNKVDPWGEQATGTLAPAPAPTTAPPGAPPAGGGSVGAGGALVIYAGVAWVTNLAFDLWEATIVVEGLEAVEATLEAQRQALLALKALRAAKAAEEAAKAADALRAATEAAKKLEQLTRIRVDPPPPPPKEEPKGPQLALGVGNPYPESPPIMPLIAFAALHGALPFYNWPDAILGPYVSNWVRDIEGVFKVGFPFAINAALARNGWVHFNLAGIDPCNTRLTYWELQQFFLPQNAHWWARTTFYMNERPLSFPEAVERIAGIMGQ